MTTRYIRGNGDGNGSSWADAAPLFDLDAQAALAGPGGSVLLLADDEYFIPRPSTDPFGNVPQIPLNHGGDVGARLSIKGVTAGGTPKKLTFTSQRAEPFIEPARGGDPGACGIGLGASHIDFGQMRFDRMGQGCIVTTAPVTDINFDWIGFKNVRRLFEATSANPITFSFWRNIVGFGFSKSTMRFVANNHDNYFGFITLYSMLQDLDRFAVGISTHGNTAATANYNFTIERFAIRGIRDSFGSYWNGDGISTEEYDHDITIRDGIVSDITDGGLDLKSATTKAERIVARRCKHSFRLHDRTDFVLSQVASLDPVKLGGTGTYDHIQAEGTAAAKVLGSHFRSNDPAAAVIQQDGTGLVVVEGGSIKAAGLVHGGAGVGPVQVSPHTRLL